MCDFKIAIPSLGRCGPEYGTHGHVDNVLYLLKTEKIPMEKIYVFVVKEEYDKYCRHLKQEYANVNVIIGALGICNQRNFITQFFNEGELIICLDDDVIAIMGSSCDKLTSHGIGYRWQWDDHAHPPIRIQYLADFIDYAYQKLVESETYIFGCYPVNNNFYLEKQKEISWDLKFLIGSFYGFIVRHDRDLILNPLAEGKEDIEQSILFYKKDGAILRFNKIACEKLAHVTGGLGGGKKRIVINNKAAEYMIATYPDYITSSFTRKNGSIEHRLKKKPKHDFKRRDVILTLCDYVYENGKFGQSSQEMLLAGETKMQKLLKYFV